jgi:HEPN domain-containing protein
MTEQLDIIKEAWRWVEKAESDFLSAEYILSLEDDRLTDTVCFHTQQCAEKYFKAFLISCGIAFPKTHDLVVLFNMLGKESNLRLHVDDFQPLNRYSMEARYPGDWNPIGIDEAKEALKMARGVRDAVRNKLPQKIC